ncbi:MAG: hypothetical protein ACQRW7_00170 [Caulobacterales bacterium]|uniref:hypothetical protein n=1 Tax=Glycocaulis sp. TaxID=1969725 RepID=UPI003F9F5170
MEELFDLVGVEGVAAIIAVVVSVFALCLSVFNFRAEFRIAWTKEVIGWARQVVSVLTEMEHDFSTACGQSLGVRPSGDRVRGQLARLSTLIDEGRFYFENNSDNDFGRDKPVAFRGYRPKLIDVLVRAYDSYRRALTNNEHDPSDTIRKRKRDFVSHVQEVINPVWFSKKAEFETEKVKVNF